ncbi:hypothetical protein EHI8A_036660 [Entamoeba histolytica HM-1:IMSS-B]|uniref:Sulfotransferase n=5 Tax=Entamoeba histolytica TaxID=5759 RepID=C4M1P4_ENTH1|nr:hypothetical protein EHI_062680 [Entamoeba histolytica HM-1:IMSS]EMD47216.1 Hypothetical protein EHI5A_060680 [Entamoeba histolytica KU27]EMH76225.1 hypothetical protein EHI8A_036660 [Entamoeba histolytica HM-1:IMSS-B]ENY60240.1 hypothetical protein EHI7A_037880 [Entamoeba histolytica HM-1:IMSS-A]GAT95150.1 hypothetical protein CL6EHI_062680 [Entamoeba histolytica]EAL45158.1 hypothetical protein EHI_062680 [Entamoeba histolytica HM-1:IMSS]|eukprot:XP_650544.1 hypothetical protein EHI_062680 [Entamoeba histolytica HM-1:IMSS]
MNISLNDWYDSHLYEIQHQIQQFLESLDPTHLELYQTLLNDTWNDLHQTEVISLQSAQFLVNDQVKEDKEQYLAFIKQTVNRIGSLMRLFKDIHINKHTLKEIRITQPIIIVGLPRSGSTTLFNIMCAHTKSHYFTSWQTLCPGFSMITEKAQRQFTEYIHNMMKRGCDDFDKIHAINPDANEECVFQYNCYGLYFAHCMALPQYKDVVCNLFSSWNSLMDFEWNVYKLNLLRRPMNNDQFLIIKNATLLCVLKDVLLSCPDIRLIWIHRNPYDIIKSSIPYFKTIKNTFLTKTNQEKVSDEWLSHNIAEIENRILKQAIDVRNEWVKQNPSRQSQIYDVFFNEIIKDPLSIVESIYHHFNINVSEIDKEVMKKALTNDYQSKIGRMTTNSIPISKEEVNSLYDWYIKQFFSKKL